MWLFTKYGFFSVVCARKNGGKANKLDPELLMVRSRSKSHLEQLLKRLDELTAERFKIIENAGTDYPFRILITKHDFSDLAHDLVDEIDYDNFKNAVKEFNPEDKRYQIACTEVWHTMKGLE